MHYNNRSDEKILKTLIPRKILFTDPNKKIKLVIYYNKFKTSNLVIKNNSSPLIGALQKKKLYINLNVLKEIVSLKITLYMSVLPQLPN